MLNKKIFLVLVLFILLGIVNVIYAQSNGGTFTLTDIPSRFNGKYIYIESDGNYTFQVSGMVNPNTPSRISNGRAVVPMWYYNFRNRGDGYVRYNGNHTLEIAIYIFESEQSSFEQAIAKIEIDVTFSNGSATRSFQDFE